MDNYISDTYEKIESRIIDTNIVCSKISALLFSNNYVAENEYLEKIIFDITNIKNMYDMFTDNINSNIVRDVYFRMLIEWMVVGYTDDPITAYSVEISAHQ